MQNSFIDLSLLGQNLRLSKTFNLSSSIDFTKIRNNKIERESRLYLYKIVVFNVILNYH